MDEITILKKVAECDLDDKKCVAKLLDNFKHSGPNGQHACIVFEQLSIIHTDLKPESVLLCSIIDPCKDPRKSGKPLILPNHKDKTTLDGGALKVYVTSDENLIKNHHKKIRRKSKQAAQCFAGNENSLMPKAGQHTSASAEYAIVWDITAAGLGLNKFCYAGLIAAHKNKEPVTDDLAS
ncbi:putative SRSF protein kinase 1-like isoform X2 [Capsicum annuum]|nr:putative SRSF protein kinase 1-like isoform X2 [Capsicum annuum]